jgi:hypothetical protein
MDKPRSPVSISGKLTIDPTITGGMNPTVRKAIDALQHGEVRVWLSSFVRDAVVYDHGNVMTAEEFIEKSAGLEYFTRVDRTEDGGMSVIGNYHTVQWGDFLVSFRFVFAAGWGETGKSGRREGEDRICRLDVSQVAY